MSSVTSHSSSVLKTGYREQVQKRSARQIRIRSLWFWLITLGATSGAAIAAQQRLPDSLQEIFKNGVEALKAGELDTAEKAFLSVLHKGGKLAFVYNNLGIVYQHFRDHEKAVMQFRQAVRLQPNYAAPHALLGASLLALGKTPEATRELERAVKLLPKEPQARIQLAKAYEISDNPQGMLEQYLALRELSPQDPEYTYQLGRAYGKLSEWCYRQILRIDPHSARLYQTLGQNYLVQGRIELAIRAFQQAAQADRKLPDVHLALAQIYLDQGKTDDALKEVEQELAIVPDSQASLVLKEKLKAAKPRS